MDKKANERACPTGRHDKVVHKQSFYYMKETLYWKKYGRRGGRAGDATSQVMSWQGERTPKNLYCQQKGRGRRC